MQTALYVLVLAGVFLTAVLATLVVYQHFFASRLAVLQRMRMSTGVEGMPQDRAFPYKNKSIREEFLGVMGKLGSIFSRRSGLKKIQRKLVQARVFIKAEEFIGVCIISELLFFLFFYGLTGSLFFSVITGLLGVKVPDLIVANKRTKKNMALTQQLPDALDIITNGLRAGFSFPQALSIVGKEMRPPISEEFSKAIRENRMGKPMDEALENIVERTGNEDLRLFITALLINRQVGGNLAEILENISHAIRERVRIKGEIKTLTAQGRLSAIILSSACSPWPWP